jgi:hypothetical protein
MIVSLVASAHAGAWTRELGDLYAKAGADYYAAVRYRAPGEAVDSTGSYMGQQYGVYAEVGVLPGWKGQLTVALPLVVGTHATTWIHPFGSEDLRASTIRTGDLRLAAQVALHPQWPLALAVDLEVPTYRNGTVGEKYPRYQPLFPKPGEGQLDVGAMVYGGGTPWDGGFAEVGVGFVHRTEQFTGWDTTMELSDGARFVAKAGRRLGSVLPVLTVDGTISPSPTPYTRSAVAVSASALWDVAPGLAVEPRVMGEVWARNASQGLGGGLGISYRR